MVFTAAILAQCSKSCLYVNPARKILFFPHRQQLTSVRTYLNSLHLLGTLFGERSLRALDKLAQSGDYQPGACNSALPAGRLSAKCAGRVVRGVGTSGRGRPPEDDRLRSFFCCLVSIQAEGRMAKSAPQRVRSNQPELALADELARIARRAQTSTLAFGAAIALLEPGTADFFCRARSGSMAPPVGIRLQVERSFTGLCIQSGEVLHCEDSETDDRVDTAVIRALGVRSIIAAPIKDQGTVIGVFAVFSPIRGAFSEIHVSALKTMSDHVAELVRGEGIARKPPATQTALVKASTIETRLAVSPAVQLLRRSGLALVPRYSRPPVRTTNLHRKVRATTLILITAVAALVVVGARTFLRTSKQRSRADRHHAGAASTEPAAVSLQPAPVSIRPAASPPPASTQVISGRVAKPPILPSTSPEAPIRPSTLPRVRMVRGAEHAQVEPRPESGRESEGPTASRSATQPAVADAVPPPTLSSVSQAGSLSAVLVPAPSLPRQAREVEPPQLVHSVPVAYPEFARQRRIRSLVLVKARIGKDGTVAKAEFAGGLPIFQDSALAAVRRWRYKPAMRDGQPVEQQIEIRLDFHP